jgi:ribosome-binding protein aMBF1 (putative translation factor)
VGNNHLAAQKSVDYRSTTVYKRLSNPPYWRLKNGKGSRTVKMGQRMTLENWRVLQGLSYKELAARLKCHEETARRYCNGSRVPRPAAYKKIRNITKEAVPYDSFIR